MRPCSRGFARRSPTRAVPDGPRDYAERGAGAHDDVGARSSRRWRSSARGRLRGRRASAIASTLAAHGASRVVVAPDLRAGAAADGGDRRGRRADADELDALDGAVTTCAAACADTGTVALDGGPGQGRRAITLVPDLHVCVVRATRWSRPCRSSSRASGRRRATGGRSCSCRARPRRPTSGSSASRASTARGASSSFSRRRPPYTVRSRGVAQPGRAPALGAGGRRFGSGHPDLARQADSAEPNPAADPRLRRGRSLKAPASRSQLPSRGRLRAAPTSRSQLPA